MEKKITTAYLVKNTSVSPFSGKQVSVTKWVKENEIPTGKSIEIIEKRQLTENWVWQNEIFTMCDSTKEPYAITKDSKVS